MGPAGPTRTRPAAVPEPGALAADYRGIVLDLDGVVYLGDTVVPAAPAALEGVRGLGVRVVFVTNNSSRPPERVAEKLGRLGVKAAVEEVLTSAHATVHLLGGEQGLRGTRVLVVGGPGLRQALEAAGARLVDPSAWRRAEVVAVGFDPELTYEKVRAAALAIRAGARFVGSNPDTTLPTPEGFWPGAGATLAMLEAATGTRPEVAGKPQRALFEMAAEALGPGPYLMVGDRADTDLDGARRLGWSTALVLSGVLGPGDLPDLAAAPDHLLADVGGLLDPPGPIIGQATPAEGPAVAALLATAGGAVPAAPGPAAPPPAPAPGPPGEASAPAGQAPGPVGEAPAPGGQAPGPVGQAADPASGPAGQVPGAAKQLADPALGAARRAGGELVAVDGERVVGAVAWRRQGPLAVITGSVVDPAWRGRLVGTRLLVAACVDVRAAGLRRVVAKAHGFLGRFGFRPPGQGEPAGEGEPPAQGGPAGQGGAGDPGGPDAGAARGLLVRDLR
jgi:glycerol-1-phosphatase